MSHRLKRQNSIVFIVTKVLKALDILHLLELLHLPHVNKTFYSHSETILMVAKIIAKNDQVWEMLKNNQNFQQENKKEQFRTKLRQLLKKC